MISKPGTTASALRPALLLIDLQNDYLHAPGVEPAPDQIVARAAELLRSCRSSGIPVLHVWTTVSRDKDERMPHWKDLGKWICVNRTPGHAPPAPLQPVASEEIIHKKFFSAFSDGTLADALKEADANALIVAGIHLHACVRETVLDAYEQGFSVFVADDAVASDDPLHAAITRRYLGSRAAQFLPVAELLTRFNMTAAATNVALVPFAMAAATSPDVISASSARAHAVWLTWSGTNFKNRRELLERLASCVAERAVPLAEQMTREIGKPITHGQKEVERAAALVCEIAHQDFFPQKSTIETGMRRRPIGVIAIITPWNNPVLIPLGKIAAALFYGNSVVWKPSPLAAAIAAQVIECLKSAGSPDGLVNLVHGDHHCALNLMSDSHVDAVTLTGGAQAGYCAQEICARRHIPLQAELGGNNAALVWSDADIDEAAKGIAEGAFAMAGQRCTANRRAIVHRDCYEHFLERLQHSVAEMRWGNPAEAGTRVGPLVNIKERNRVAELIARAGRDGLQIIVPHHRHSPLNEKPGVPDAYYPPTIVCCDNPRHEIVQEETFGPVLVIQKTADWTEAINLCNGVRQGLVAAIFTRSAELQHRFLNEARAGVLKINQSTADVGIHLPFGGWKASGVGPPEHGITDQEFYTRVQTIYADGKQQCQSGTVT